MIILYFVIYTQVYAVLAKYYTTIRKHLPGVFP